MQKYTGYVAAVAHACYGLSAWLAFVTIVLPLAAVVAVLPGLERRRAITRHAARLVLFMMAARPRIKGLEHLPAEPCIVVANHASYVDGMVLAAALPPRFSFVIKREMTRVPVAHLFLRRIGSQFVERFDTRRGAADARRIIALAESRHSLAFFPEGTFHPEPGLRRFQSGAFAAAVRGNVPVIPVVIRGTRHMLAGGTVLPRPSRLEVIVKPAVRHNGGDDAVAQLRSACRASMLDELAEPDLGGRMA